jgi:hypothetical protein
MEIVIYIVVTLVVLGLIVRSTLKGPPAIEEEKPEELPQEPEAETPEILLPLPEGPEPEDFIPDILEDEDEDEEPIVPDPEPEEIDDEGDEPLSEESEDSEEEEDPSSIDEEWGWQDDEVDELVEALDDKTPSSPLVPVEHLETLLADTSALRENAVDSLRVSRSIHKIMREGLGEVSGGVQKLHEDFHEDLQNLHEDLQKIHEGLQKIPEPTESGDSSEALLEEMRSITKALLSLTRHLKKRDDQPSAVTSLSQPTEEEVVYEVLDILVFDSPANHTNRLNEKAQEGWRVVSSSFITGSTEGVSEVRYILAKVVS